MNQAMTTTTDVVVRLHDVDFDIGAIGRFCRRKGITRMSLFGSILTDRFGPESDVDFLVEFDPSRRVSLFDVGGMIVEIEEMLGRRADLRAYEDLSRYFRDEVIQNARLLYAA